MSVEAMSLPRVVIVTRKTPFELLLERWGTHTQAAFYLESRGQRMQDYELAHERFLAALQTVLRQLPVTRRQTRVDRTHLDRFLFAPDDVVAFVGQDGLVANAAKYLQGQLAIGVNPDPSSYEGVLVPHPPERFSELLAYAEGQAQDRFTVQERTMVEATREDGQKLLALNEIYIGHRTHQSSRYRIRFGDKNERHSSSGVIVASGTGCTGWTRSIATPLKDAPPLPQPEDQRLVFFVREAWPSVATGTEVTKGVIPSGERLVLASDMPEEGIAFGDGIESDPVEFLSGQQIALSVSETKLRLVQPATLEQRR
jgi:NAD kinase